MTRLLLLGALALTPLLSLTGGSDAVAAPATPTAEELLGGMDTNLQFETRSVTMTMTVNDGKRTREFKMVAMGRGETDSAIEYLAPDREKGTRMLKLDDQLWIYMPKAERTQKVSGHMMRQGMMGSDMSYEDMMAGADFQDMYTATVIGSEDVDGRLHWRVEATAKDTSVTYPKRVILVDDATRIPTVQELYGLSGMLMKTWTMSDVQEIGGQMTPMRMEVKDMLREGSSTQIVMSDLTYGIELEDEVFSMRWLERGG